MNTNFSAATLLQQGNDELDRGQYKLALATFQEAAALEPQNHQILYAIGLAYYRLDRYQEAIEPLNRALEIQPEYTLALARRGLVYQELNQPKLAQDDFKRAIQITPQDYEGWNGRGIAFDRLKQYKDAITNFTQASKLKPDDRLAYCNRGYSWSNLGRYEEAIVDYTEAIKIKSDDYIAHYHRGIARANLGRYKEAIVDYTEVIALNPNDYAYHNRGLARHKLGRDEEAIADYTETIKINRDDHIAYCNRGVSLNYLGRYDEAIADFKQAIALNPDDHIAYNGLGSALYNLGRYDEAIAEYNKAIDIKGDFWEAQANLGIAHYNRGQQQANPFPDWLKARASYQEALEYLTGQNLHQEYLEVLQKLIEVCRYLPPAHQIEELLQQGAEQLGQWLQDPNLSLGQRITLERKFASFNQVRVDTLANSNNPKNQLEALELAEQRKNTCIAWLHQQNLNEADKLPYAEMQTLLQPRTAAIYWHVSPAGITTFIIKHNQPPQIFTPSPAPQSHQASLQTQAYPPHAYQFQQFQKWMQEWQQSYQDYHQGNFPPDIVAKENAPWRQNINVMLYNRLRNLLETNRLIREHLQDIDRLILIPHRELHLLPLHILFPGRFTTTYLPTFQVGLNLKLIQPNPHQKSLLNVENSLNELPFTAIESIAISACHSQTRTLTNTTPTELLQQLTSNSGYFHFAGHAAHEPEEPRASALDLGNSEKLTLGEIFDQKLDFNQYQLICLSACETGITSNQSLLDEYVGFVSGFLAKGSQYVISTLWTVDERSAALLMIEFYQKLSQLTPPLALKEAQEWLRSVTYEKLAEWYRQLAATLREQAAKNSAIPHCCAYLETEAQIILADSVKMASSEPPFQSPYHWAGFTIHGNLT